MFKPKTGILALLVLPALALPMQATAKDRLPLKGSESGTFRLLGPCETGGMILEVTGTGNSTRLGSYSARYRECLDPETGAVTHGTFTLTAADGDELFGTYSGQSAPTGEPGVVTYDDPGVITGGTGRFEGASGTANTRGSANLATGEYSGVLTGSVSRRTAG